METLKLIERISNGEDSYTQFKENITNGDKLAEEFVAFSNTRGGILIIGVKDSGDIKGLESDDIRRLNQLIGNVINDSVTPPIYPLVEVKTVNTKKLLIISIDEGINKPYSTNKGVYLTKAGSDKRKISPQELRRLFAESKELFADEEILIESDITDINSELFYQFLYSDDKDIYDEIKNGNLELKTILNNYALMKNSHLTLSGNLLFGMIPQKFSPSFYVDCCYFKGNDISSSKYISEGRVKGTFKTIYKDSMSFLVSHLRAYQKEADFNSNGVLEIDREVLSELIINALVHRDYYINSSIKIFIFDDRVEIISPGKLTNSLTIQKIKRGISIHRNPILDSITKNLLPYSGRGSGIKRVLRINPNIELINDIDKEEFKCIIPRKVEEI